MKKREKKMVFVMGGLEWIEIWDMNELKRLNVRYVGTDFTEDIDVYEELFTGKLLGVINSGLPFDERRM